MARLTDDQWAAIRVAWEEEPSATYDTAAGTASFAHGFKAPSKSSVCERAKKEGWSKRGQLASINEAASRRADAASDPNGQPNAEPNENQSPFGVANLATREESETKRAAVLVRHRQEWADLEQFRQAALMAVQDARAAGDRTQWLIAKTAADTALANMRALDVKQQGEARAWMLDLKQEEDLVIRNPRVGGAA